MSSGTKSGLSWPCGSDRDCSRILKASCRALSVALCSSSAFCIWSICTRQFEACMLSETFLKRDAMRKLSVGSTGCKDDESRVRNEEERN